MKNGLISVNGSVTSAQAATVPALDRGFLFGDNVFEVFVAFKNKILDVAPHLNRLRDSAANLYIDIPWTDEDLAFELQSLCEQLKASKTNLRLVITRGSGLTLSTDNLQPNKIVFAYPAKVEPESTYQAGLRLLRKQLPLTERGANPKTGNYLRSIVALKQAHDKGYDEILWNNDSNEITESSTSNVFFIGRDGDSVEVATPSVQSGILKGITRQTIMDLLNNAQIPVTERIIYVDEIPRFDEAFLCSTVRGLVPIKAIDKHILHTAREKSVYRHFEHLFLTWVQTQIGYRPQWNTGEPSA